MIQVYVAMPPRKCKKKDGTGDEFRCKGSGRVPVIPEDPVSYITEQMRIPVLGPVRDGRV